MTDPEQRAKTAEARAAELEQENARLRTRYSLLLSAIHGIRGSTRDEGLREFLDGVVTRYGGKL